MVCEAGEQGEGDSGVGTIGAHMAAGLLGDGIFHLRASFSRRGGRPGAAFIRSHNQQH